MPDEIKDHTLINLNDPTERTDDQPHVHIIYHLCYLISLLLDIPNLFLPVLITCDHLITSILDHLFSKDLSSCIFPLY